MQDNQIIYDLVKETRDDVKAIDAKLNAHILHTQKQLVIAKAPQTFFKTISSVALWVAALSGLISFVSNLLAQSKH